MPTITFDYFYELYIPHGSDKISIKKTRNERRLELYIPHGSDKIRQILTDNIFRATLYPTWFG